MNVSLSRHKEDPFPHIAGSQNIFNATDWTLDKKKLLLI